MDRLAFLMTIRSEVVLVDEKSELGAASGAIAASILGSAGGATAKPSVTTSDDLEAPAGIKEAQDASMDAMITNPNKIFLIFIAFSFLFSLYP
jgi:hypothetical protein